MSDYKTIVFFDLETTGLDTDACHVTQLSAVCGEKNFDVYVLPLRPISSKASEVTGITVKDGQMFHYGKQVETTPFKEALTKFIDFIGGFPQPVLLAAHNGGRFDAPVLSRVLTYCSLSKEFLQVVTGFLDTLMLGKRLHPGLDRYTQRSLVDKFLSKKYDAHNALADAGALQELVNKWDPSREDILKSTEEAREYEAKD